MGREVRRVHANWQHPKNESGTYIPLFDGYTRKAAEWDEEYTHWQRGLRRAWPEGWKPIEAEFQGRDYTAYAGDRPLQQDYMPDWPESERTHWQMYEDTTEGTPISPVMATPEALARWLADNKASAFGAQTATYEQWLATIREGWVPSAVIQGGTLRSGVADATRETKRGNHE